MKKYRVLKDSLGNFKEGEIAEFVRNSEHFYDVSLYKNKKGTKHYLSNEHSDSPDVELIEEDVVLINDYHKEIEKLYKQNFQTFLDKNRKYGNSFQDTFRELGEISALTRMNDKFNRIKTMMLSGEVDNEESLSDDLLDLANYCIMTSYELKLKEGKDK